MIHVWYHAGCWDGFGAAWAVHNAFRGGDTTLKYTPVQYGERFPEIESGDVVYFVDFSPKREQLDRLLEVAHRVLILDHHKTAIEELADYQNGEKLEKYVELGQSGAVMAWKYFRGDHVPVPGVLLFIQDRDLWEWKLTKSKEINAFIRSIPMSFEEWDKRFLEEPDWVAIAAQGAAILREQDRVVQEHVRRARMVDIGGHVAPAVNATVYFSEIAGELAMTHETFGAAYFIRSDGKVQYSLRSRGDFDVSEVAKQYGGGGHRNAAGFEVDRVL